MFTECTMKISTAANTTMKHLRHTIFFMLIIGSGLTGCSRDKPQPKSLPTLAGHNLLLITLDTTRADRLGCYGYGEAQTPTLDRLAQSGVLFEDAQSQIPLTLPSHCSIMTGRFPGEHGVHLNGRMSLGDQFPTLATVFKQQGYDTAAFISSFVLDDRFGLNRGFDIYNADVGQVEPGMQVWELERSADVVTDRALNWLRTTGDKPFLGWIHYYDPHDPYKPPPTFRLLNRHPYDGEIAFMDTQIRRLIDLLEKRNLLQKTLIVIAGDHGESLGEHQEWGHVTFLYDTHLHVPLIFSHPSMLPSGLRINTVVSLVDLFPTILDLFGWDQPKDLLSRSLMPALSGHTLKQVSGFAQNHYAYQLYGWAQQHSVIHKRWKYISSTKPELYDRQRDQHETNNLILKHPDVASSMLDLLKQRHNSMKRAEAPVTQLDQESLRRLETLGYVSGQKEFDAEVFLTPGLNDPKDFVDVLQLLKKTSSFIQHGRYVEAIPILESVVKRCPESVRVHHVLGKCYMKMRRYNKAIDQLDLALQIDNEYRQAHRTMADTMGHAGRFKEAVGHYVITLKLREDDPQTHFNLGTALLQMKELSKSAEHFNRALELKSDYSEALFNLGVCYKLMGDLDQARKTFLKVTADPSRAADAYDYLGTIATEQDKLEEAVDYYEQSLEYDPIHDPTIYKLLGIYESTKRPADAIRILRKAVTRSPNNLKFLQILVIYLTTTDKHLQNSREAIKYAQQATELSENRNPKLLMMLADAYSHASDHEQAILIAEKALEHAESQHLKLMTEQIKKKIKKYRSEFNYRTNNP